MKRVLLSIAIIAFFSLQSAAQTQQNAKAKPAVEAVADTSAIKISFDLNRISVKNAPIGEKLIVFSVVGLKLKEFEMKTSSGEYVINLPRGIYILKIGETVQKCVVK